MRLTLFFIGLAGAVVFGAAFALTYVSPIHVERASRGFVESQIEQQLSQRFGIMRGETRSTRAGRLAGALAEHHDAEIAALRGQIASGLTVQIAAAVARMQDLSCECRERLRTGLNAAMESRISSLERAEPQLRRIIEGEYSEIVSDLLRDLRIFTGTNTIAFMMLLGLAVLKPGRLHQLFVCGILLGAAAAATSALYLFGQNWFFTLLYADYVGWSYGIWLLLVFGLFSDIILFKARATTRVVNAALSILGKAPVPC